MSIKSLIDLESELFGVEIQLAKELYKGSTHGERYISEDALHQLKRIHNDVVFILAKIDKDLERPQSTDKES